MAAGSVLILEVFSVRYYKGPRSPEYFIFLNFFIILFSSWAISVLFKINKVAGLIILLIFTALCLSFSTTLLVRPSNSKATLNLLQTIKQNETEPVSLFVLPSSHENAYTLYYFLLKQKLASKDGIPLAICDNHDSAEKGREFCPLSHRLSVSDRFILYDYSSFTITDRSLYPSEQVSPERLYKRTYNNYELEKY